jgi:hypothetical protein
MTSEVVIDESWDSSTATSPLVVALGERNVIDIDFTMPLNSRRFCFNLVNQGQIIYHFNPRVTKKRGFFIIQNVCLNNAWGPNWEEIKQASFIGHKASIRIAFDALGVQVFIEGAMIPPKFMFRAPIHGDITLEVPVFDNGLRELVIVHSIALSKSKLKAAKRPIKVPTASKTVFFRGIPSGKVQEFINDQLRNYVGHTVIELDEAIGAGKVEFKWQMHADFMIKELNRFRDPSWEKDTRLTVEYARNVRAKNE